MITIKRILLGAAIFAGLSLSLLGIIHVASLAPPKIYEIGRILLGIALVILLFYLIGGVFIRDDGEA